VVSIRAGDVDRVHDVELSARMCPDVTAVGEGCRVVQVLAPVEEVRRQGSGMAVDDVRPGAKANARATATGDSRAAGLDGGSWAFRPLHAGGARDGYVERDHHHHCLRSS